MIEYSYNFKLPTAVTLSTKPNGMKGFAHPLITKKEGS